MTVDETIAMLAAMPVRRSNRTPKRANGTARKPLSTFPCVYRGEPTGERTTCKTCDGGVQLPVQACELFGRCVAAKQPDDKSVACCRDCVQRVEPVQSTAEVRNGSGMRVLRDSANQLGLRSADADAGGRGRVLPVVPGDGHAHLHRPNKRAGNQHRDGRSTGEGTIPRVDWPPRVDALPPRRRITVAVPPGHFNASLTRDGGTLRLATRFHERIYLYSLDPETFQPQAATVAPLNLHHPAAMNGHEDPRLFRHGDDLCVGFAGIKSGRKRHELRISQLYARLTANGPIIHAPQYADAGPIEKNWGWFSHDGELYAVYSVSPHVVLRIAGDAVAEVHRTPNVLPWTGGYLRGGAPPVRVGDEYICWIHGADDARRGRVYNVGVYAFEAKPPFRVTRQAKAPLLWATDAERMPAANGRGCVVFPAGAVLDGGVWRVSAGVADQRVEIFEWDATDVAEVLR